MMIINATVVLIIKVIVIVHKDIRNNNGYTSRVHTTY